MPLHVSGSCQPLDCQYDCRRRWSHGRIGTWKPSAPLLSLYLALPRGSVRGDIRGVVKLQETEE